MRIPFYGVLLPATFVLAIYGGQHASPYDAARPLVVLTLVAAIAFFLIGRVTHRWHGAALVVAFGVLAVFRMELCLLVVVWLVVSWWNARRTGSWGVAPKLTPALNAFVLAWFAVASAAALVTSLPPPLPRAGAASVQPGPNLYLILLDGYPRHDSLVEYFGFDNRPFLDALSDRGFEVAEDSTALYPSTIQTLATMMQMDPLDQLLAEEWSGSHEQHRRLWHLINDAAVPEAYEVAGYTTYSIVPPAPGHDWRTADVVLDSPWLSDFEAHLLDRGILRFVVPYRAMQRAEILDAFDYLRAAVGTSPRFVFAHIMSPHSPYVFAADGSPAALCFDDCRNHAGPPNPTLGDRLVGQIQFLNSKVLEAVDHIVGIDPEATVIVLSDHGLRRDRNDMDEWFRTLFAARGQSFADNASAAEVFETLLAER